MPGDTCSDAGVSQLCAAASTGPRGRVGFVSQELPGSERELVPVRNGKHLSLATSSGCKMSERCKG